MTAENKTDDLDAMFSAMLGGQKEESSYDCDTCTKDFSKPLPVLRQP